MDNKKHAPTIILQYDIIGKICPHGMTRDNCHLRQALNDWRLKFPAKFGYHSLDNGNLLVPRVQYFHFPSKSGEYFNLDATVKNMCNGVCRYENERKANQNHNLAQIQTVIMAYTMYGVNCPETMNHKNCPLRRELSKMQEQYHIGYFPLNEKVLVMPNGHYDSQTNVYRDILAERIAICDKCRGYNSQR